MAGTSRQQQTIMDSNSSTGQETDTSDYEYEDPPADDPPSEDLNALLDDARRDLGDVIKTPAPTAHPARGNHGL